jgi:RHS repeat-associated protein
MTPVFLYRFSPKCATRHKMVIYDGKVVVQERDRNDNPLVSYTRGVDLSGTMQGAGGIGGLLARTDANGSTYYHADGNGNVTALVNGSGTLVASYLYDPYGNMLGMWGALAPVNTYRYSSKEIDWQSGLYYYGYRYYEPNLQRWINRDPIQENGGLNLYEYVANNPINRIFSSTQGGFSSAGASYRESYCIAKCTCGR